MPSTCFIAECLWPNVTPEDVAALDRRLSLRARPAVRHVGTTHVPEDDVVFVWFEAGSVGDVELRCLSASVPFDRIVAVTGWPLAGLLSTHERTRP